MIPIDCECCGLQYMIRDLVGAIPTVCGGCYLHRGPLQQVARAESHAEMLRERLTACRASEERARQGKAAANDRMTAALDSRGRLADRLVEAAESGGIHNCPAQQLGRDPEVVEFARKHRGRRGSS